MNQKFEKTDPHYPVAGLVGLGIAIAGLLAPHSEKKQTRAN